VNQLSAPFGIWQEVLGVISMQNKIDSASYKTFYCLGELKVLIMEKDIQKSKTGAQRERRQKLRKEIIDIYGGECECGEGRYKYLTPLYNPPYKDYPHGYQGWKRLEREGWPGPAVEIICYECRAEQYPEQFSLRRKRREL